MSLIDLSPLQLRLLENISKTDLNASQFVRTLDLPLSTAWHNLRRLRGGSLITFGNKEPISLTRLGRMFPAVAQLVERSAVEALLSETQCPKALAEKGRRDREVAGASLARGTFGKGLIKSRG